MPASPDASAHMSELAHRSHQIRRENADLADAARRLAARTRAAQNLPETITDIDVIERVTAMLILGGES